MEKKLVLASSSVFRKALLERLNIPFVCASPNIDESPNENESPENLAQRLSIEKAKALAKDFPNALIIGSDQVATANGKIYGKPKTLENGVLQLKELSGKSVDFLSALTLLNAKTGNVQSQCVLTRVQFRQLTESEIRQYLNQEPDALNCAGSAKSESLGIALLEKIQSNDPTALVGLPLIALCQMLRQENAL